MEFLTVKEVAILWGCSERYIRSQIAAGNLQAEEKKKAGRGGVRGMSYRIPLASLDEKLVKKYLRQQRKKKGLPEPKPERRIIEMNVEQMTLEERREVADWKLILEEWRLYRAKGGLKADRDDEFIPYIQAKYPEYHFTKRGLYRQAQALREQGEAALMDRRGKHNNHKKLMKDEVFDIFISYYLDQSQKSVQKCIRMTETWAEHEGRADLLPLPSNQTFTREIMRRVPPAVIVYCREGEKACTDKMLPYIRRTYDDLQSNDIWVCDNHTFDVFVNDGEHKKPIRVYLTAFQDIRSRKFTGWYVTLSPSSAATLIALRRGIEACGIPKRILSDNGREFLTFDIGGRGFRKTSKTDEHEAPTILDHLGIEFRTAMVKNARAKIIERAFREVKEDFSKMFEGYTGGTIMERPERLKKSGKDAANFTLLPDFIQYVDQYITGIFNKSKHGGIGMGNRTPDQVWAACLIEQRIATNEQLNLMMLRNTRMQTVGRDGVKLELYGQKLAFNSNELNLYHIKRKVYLRYDPDHLEQVRVYDEQDRFICTAQQTGAIGYFEDKQAVADAMKEQRRYKRAVKDWAAQHVKQAHNELELLMWQAEQNIAADQTKASPKITYIHQLDEDAEKGLARAAGFETAPMLDFTEGIRRLKEAAEE